MYNSINQKLPYKSIRAINDTKVVNFLKSIFNKIQLIKILNDTTLEKIF